MGYTGQPFQHTAARRRLVGVGCERPDTACVSTHSRPKAAGKHWRYSHYDNNVSTHSRPKAAGNLVAFLLK